MSKKYSVFRDELDIKHPNGGIYCFMAFEYLDKNKKAVFKIGQTTRPLEKRGDNYHTYFPMGVTTIANLENPTDGLEDKTNADTRKKRYEQIEKFIINDIIEKGGYQIISTAKSTNRGKTEWVYTDIDSIYDAFTKAKAKYGGTLKKFDLDDEEYVEFRKKKLRDKHYMAKIIYPLVNPPWFEAPKKKGKKKK